MGFLASVVCIGVLVSVVGKVLVGNEVVVVWGIGVDNVEASLIFKLER